MQGVPLPHGLVPWVLWLRIPVGKYQSHFITNRTNSYIDTHAEFSVPRVCQSHSNAFAEFRDGATNADVNSEVSGVGRADDGELVRSGRFGKCVGVEPDFQLDLTFVSSRFQLF